MDPALSQVIKHGTIVAHDGLITAVGNNIPISEGAHVINLNGGAVIPGFVDTQAKWNSLSSRYPGPSWELEAFLGYGITTVHNAESQTIGGFYERGQVERGDYYGPRIYQTGDILYGSTESDCYTEITSLHDARDAILRIKAEGGQSSFSVNNYQQQSRSARQQLLLAASELNYLVFSEGGFNLDWDLTYFIDGMSVVNHAVPIPELFDDVLSLIAASGTSYTPIAVRNYGGLFGENWVHQNHQLQNDQKLRSYVKQEDLEQLTEIKMAPNNSYQLFNSSISAKKLLDLGVRTNIGSDGTHPLGLLFHSEMQFAHMGGETPYEVLRAATLNGAKSLGLNSSLGSITVGKLADMIIYPPEIQSVDMIWKDSSCMRYVVRGGRVFNVSDGLEEFWPNAGQRVAKGRWNADDTV